MEYARNNRRRKKNLSCSDVSYYLRGKGPHRNCKESKPVELSDQNVPYGGVLHSHNGVLRGGQNMGHYNRRTNNTYNYCRGDGAKENVGEVTYVFYEPLRYPAFKMADRHNEGDAAKKNPCDKSEEDKVVPPVGGQSGGSCEESEEMSMNSTNVTRVGKTKKAGECNSRDEKKQRSRDHVDVKGDRHSGDETAQEARMSAPSSTKQCDLSPPRGTREKKNFFIPVTPPTVHRHPSQITNEVKFILHMTILTLYRDQIKPSYKKIKQRLGSFHQNEELKNNFLEIFLSLQNEYLVVKSKRNNIFVLLRETPKWFSGWIKTRSFANPYPEKFWRKFARHLLHACRAGPSSPQGYFTVQFAKQLCREGHLFFQSSDALEGVITLLGQPSDSYDTSTHGATTPCSLLHDEPAGSYRELFTFNLLHECFSYFSHLNDSAVRLVDSSLVSLYQSILSDDGNRVMSSRGRSGEEESIHSSRSHSLCNDPLVVADPPWELNSDIYKAADGLKKRGLPFLKDYSVGKIAHIVQLGLYSGLLHEEGQTIKPACCCRGVAASVWGDPPREEPPGGGNPKRGMCDRVPLVPTAEDAKVKIDQLLKGSRGKIIFFCSLKDQFFKKFEEVLSPVHFGCRSLVEFLFFQCQEVCKLFLLNGNIILVHPSCDEQSLMDMLRQEEEENVDMDVDENIIEQFDYTEYVSSVTYPQKSSQNQQGSLQICSTVKDLLGNRKKDNFFITFSFWKYVMERGKAPTR
ncbi:Uncharacterized protein PCOAH_00048300 [Plasmodium coatneyi]|uniref:Uncharacterized protein n=1 Tax=Plasmodium coatneyi TaxID=208452 RepID=A0A1B1E630_9APIC|nr:Uncharacterized protein PCOAH_00048300 [Plasmodium coatneyi]ANQ10443.1 Uncharacterized protein PCOAH_00048300 [Plasmodium coatneyi]